MNSVSCFFVPTFVLIYIKLHQGFSSNQLYFEESTKVLELLPSTCTTPSEGNFYIFFLPLWRIREESNEIKSKDWDSSIYSFCKYQQIRQNSPQGSVFGSVSVILNCMIWSAIIFIIRMRMHTIATTIAQNTWNLLHGVIGKLAHHFSHAMLQNGLIFGTF